MTDDANQEPHVVIIGGGFGGLYAARALSKAPVRITLIDVRNHHVFQPLLYQVATAALNPSDIAAPIRGVLRRQKNVTVLLGEAVSIDPVERRVVLQDGEIPFDYLIVATGVTHSYFGHSEWSKIAPGLKTIDDALSIRRRILLAYEDAEREADAVRQRALMTFVVIGGGPTGVELAGALAEIAKHAMPGDFRRIDPSTARVILLEGQKRILTAYPADLSSKAVEQLVRLGVEVRTGAIVTQIDESGVVIEGEQIAARTILWAAGVEASPLVKSLGVPLDRAGRVIVHPDLTIPTSDRIFVIGDVADASWKDGIVPGVAQGAIQGGQHAASNIERSIRGEPLVPFHYDDKGSLATIGRASGIAWIGRLKLSGFVAWFAWLAIHIFFLIGFRNRFLVIAQWAWSYLTWQRGARLITGDTQKQ